MNAYQPPVKSSRWRLTLSAAGLGLSALLSSVAFSACTSEPSDVCQVVCDCIICNDRQHEICEADVALVVDVANEYDCDDEVDNLTLCWRQDAQCQDRVFDFENECQPERDALTICQTNASDISGSSNNNNSSSSGNNSAVVACNQVCDRLLECFSNDMCTCDPGQLSACGNAQARIDHLLSCVPQECNAFANCLTQGPTCD